MVAYYGAHGPGGAAVRALAVAVGILLAGCASAASGPTQAQCDAIAQEIRDHGGHEGVCHLPMLPQDARFTDACAALKQCEDSLGK